MENKNMLIRDLELKAQIARNDLIYYNGIVTHLEERKRLYKRNYRLVQKENKSWIRMWREATKPDVKAGYLEWVRINDDVLNKYNRWYDEVCELLEMANEHYKQKREQLIKLQKQIDYLRTTKD